MGDLAEATHVERSNTNTFQADLSPDWEIWGPNGGYLASVALRAAGITSERARPVSIHAHFVGAGRTAPVQIRTEVNRATKVATSVTVHLEQEGRPWLVATVWGADDDLPGLEHQTGDKPVVPGPDDLPNMATLMAGQGEPPHPFWHNLEQRPLAWIEDWDDREVQEPTTSSWVQFVPTATYPDPWVDAGRSLILIDLDAWSAPFASLTNGVVRWSSQLPPTSRNRHCPIRWIHGYRRLAVERSVCSRCEQWTHCRNRQDLEPKPGARSHGWQHVAVSPGCPSPRQVSPAVRDCWGCS